MYQRFPQIIIERQAQMPVYAQIVSQVISHILTGRLKRGQRLPGARVLAAKIKVHRKTLQTALDELLQSTRASPTSI
jgi:GntR family transcriptional regulator / MocR family aminotransferase